LSKIWDKLIVALDLEDESKIKDVVRVLLPQGVKFKIGSIAFTKFGPKFVENLISSGADIFLDLKLHDIPNTMKRAAAVITGLGCWAFTVHTSAGREALAAVKEEVLNTARESGLKKPLILGVTVLTSQASTQKEVLDLAKLACETGLDGVIASSRESKVIKEKYEKLKVITPGIRSALDKTEDQKRVATAQYALGEGKADYIVVGRPIINEKDYLRAAERILQGTL